MPGVGGCGTFDEAADLVREVGGESIAYKADARDSDYLEGMKMANSLCAWIRRFLGGPCRDEAGQPGISGLVYVYLFRVRQADGRWPKTARVLHHLVLSDAHYRSSRKR